MKNIIYKQGDVLNAERIEAKDSVENGIIIPHICNNKGGWGSGFVVNLSKKWKEPEEAYRRMGELSGGYRLGDVGFISRDSLYGAVTVANMIAQDGFRSFTMPVAVDYTALVVCLDKVYEYALMHSMEVHTIRIGCGLGGGDWNVVEKILMDMIERTNVTTVVYDL